MTKTLISFVGAGPGAPDLITIRGMKRLEAADVVIWASSLVSEEILQYCKKDVQTFGSSGMTLEEIVSLFDRFENQKIVRLHSGDPTLYGAIAEQIEWCYSHDRSFEIVPGVSSLAATAAAAGRELTIPGISQSVIATRLSDRTKRSMGKNEELSAMAQHGVTMALFLSASLPDQLQDELLSPQSGYSKTTPVIVAHRVSWPDERIVTAKLCELADTIRSLGVSTTVLVLVGEALSVSPPMRSHVYTPTYAHSFRSGQTKSE